jgi:hypothetical protein
MGGMSLLGDPKLEALSRGCMRTGCEAPPSS